MIWKCFSVREIFFILFVLWNPNGKMYSKMLQKNSLPFVIEYYRDGCVSMQDEALPIEPT